MAEDSVHPVPGADDGADIWNSLAEKDGGKTPTTDKTSVAEVPVSTSDRDEPRTGAQPRDPATGRFASTDSDDATTTASGTTEVKPAADGADKTTSTDTDAGRTGAARDTAAAASSATPDPFATATPEQRAAIEATRTELNEKTTEVRRLSGTVSGLQRRINKLEADLKTAGRATPKGDKPAGAAATASETVPATDQPTSIADDPELNKIAEEYPEFAPKYNRTIQGLEGKIAKLEKELGGVSEKHREANLKEQNAVVVTAHSDYDEIRGSEAFRQWFDAAPDYVRLAVERNADHVVDGHEVSHVVKLFKADTGWKPKAAASRTTASSAASPAASAATSTTATRHDPKRQDQLESAAGTRSRTPSVASRGDPDDPETIWRRAADQERSRAAR